MLRSTPRPDRLQSRSPWHQRQDTHCAPRPTLLPREHGALPRKAHLELLDGGVAVAVLDGLAQRPRSSAIELSRHSEGNPARDASAVFRPFCCVQFLSCHPSRSSDVHRRKVVTSAADALHASTTARPLLRHSSIFPIPVAPPVHLALLGLCCLSTQTRGYGAVEFAGRYVHAQRGLSAQLLGHCRPVHVHSPGSSTIQQADLRLRIDEAAHLCVLIAACLSSALPTACVHTFEL